MKHKGGRWQQVTWPRGGARDAPLTQAQCRHSLQPPEDARGGSRPRVMAGCTLLTAHHSLCPSSPEPRSQRCPVSSPACLCHADGMGQSRHGRRAVTGQRWSWQEGPGGTLCPLP